MNRMWTPKVTWCVDECGSRLARWSRLAHYARQWCCHTKTTGDLARSVLMENIFSLVATWARTQPVRTLWWFFEVLRSYPQRTGHRLRIKSKVNHQQQGGRWIPISNNTLHTPALMHHFNITCILCYTEDSGETLLRSSRCFSEQHNPSDCP